MESSDVIVEAHVECPVEGCGSSDGFTWYEDHGFCYVCRTRVNEGPNGEASSPSRSSRKSKPRDKSLIELDHYAALAKRGLSEETCRKFGYFLGRDKNGKLVQVAPYRNEDGQVVGQKVRGANKSFRTTGEFKNVQLFGQHLWGSASKRIVVTEGEIDAMSAHQMLGSWPVVSLPNGAQSAAKAIRDNLEFFDKFEKIILSFDMDKPGREAVDSVIPLFTPGKVLVMEMPLKDASDMLMANKVKEFVNCFWEAVERTPAGIVSGEDLWDEVSSNAEMGASLPWSGLTSMTYGQRGGELWTWCSGSGMGKSEFVSELAYHNLIEHKEKVGYMALEESLRRTGQRLMAKHLQVPIHLPDYSVGQAEMKEAFKATTGSGRVFLYDHWGSQASDEILSKLRFMIVGKGCKTVVLDHLSIIVSGLDNNDERKTIDKLMTDLRSLVEETGVKMHLVSHLRRPMGKGHEEGGKVSLAHLRGSHSIVQLSDFVVGLERNQQSKKNSNVTRLRLLKNRYSGETGVAAAVEYQKDTGMLIEVDPSTFDEPEQEDRQYGESFDGGSDY